LNTKRVLLEVSLKEVFLQIQIIKYRASLENRDAFLYANGMEFKNRKEMNDDKERLYEK
jgi:hypothetical protein